MKIFLKIPVVLIIFIPAIIFSQAKVGTAGGQFLELSPSPRAEGMANAFIAVADDIFCIYYNPAGLALQLKKQVAFSHTMLYSGIGLEWGAFSMPAAGGVMAISATACNAGEMEETTPYFPEGTGRTFTAGAMSACITYSRSLTDRFSVGINAKYIGEYLADISANGWGMDIGTYFRTAFHGVRLGMILSNFGPDLKYIQQSAPLPMAFHFGAAGEVINNGTHRVTLDLEGSHPNDNIEKFQAGFEYGFKEFAFIRGGYKLQYDTEKFTLGGGIKIPFGGMSARADYAYTYLQYLPALHRFSICTEF